MPLTQETYSWYEVSSPVKELLLLASENWENSPLAQAYMTAALHQAGDNIHVLIGAYRFFFYKGQSAMALQVAEKVLDQVKTKEKLPYQWEFLKPILVSRQNEPMIRLFIHAYSAKGFLLARLGKLEEAKAIVERIQEIDAKREYCATTVFEVLTQSPEEE